MILHATYNVKLSKRANKQAILKISKCNNLNPLCDIFFAQLISISLLINKMPEEIIHHQTVF